MKKKKLKKQIKKLKKALNWYRSRWIGEMMSDKMRELNNGRY